jgi:hypothetical protein
VSSGKRKFQVIDATSKETVPFANLSDRELDVLRRVKQKHSEVGATVRYASDDEIHACLRLPHSPVAPGLSAAASAAAFKAWVVAQFHAEHDKAEVESGSGTFHQLNWSEVARVQNRYVECKH